MKIIKVSSAEGSFCSTEIKVVTKYISEQLISSLKQKGENKIVIETFELSDAKQSLSSEIITKEKNVA